MNLVIYKIGRSQYLTEMPWFANIPALEHAGNEAIYADNLEILLGVILERQEALKNRIEERCSAKWSKHDKTIGRKA